MHAHSQNPCTPNNNTNQQNVIDWKSICPKNKCMPVPKTHVHPTIIHQRKLAMSNKLKIYMSQQQMHAHSQNPSMPNKIQHDTN